MTLPLKFRKSPEGTITSFDFYDLATGTGYKILNGADFLSIDASIISKGLTVNTFHSNQGWTEVGGATPSTTTFDMYIGKPITVSGEIYYELNFSCDDAKSIAISAGLFMVKNGVETQIGNWNRGAGTIPANGWDFITTRGNVPNTLFPEGSLLRFKLLSSLTTGATGAILHDPMDRSGLYSSNVTSHSTLKIFLPIRITD